MVMQFFGDRNYIIIEQRQCIFGVICFGFEFEGRCDVIFPRFVQAEPFRTVV